MKMRNVLQAQCRAIRPEAKRIVPFVMAASVLAFAACAQSVFAQAKPAAADDKAASKPAKLTENDRIVHVLNRLGFGPRPDDIAKVKQMGLKEYIEQQLHPEQIDDSAVDQKLQLFPELQASDTDIEQRYKEFITQDQAENKLRQQLRKMEAQKAAAAAAPAADPTMTTQAGAAPTGAPATTPPPATTTPPVAPPNPQQNALAVRQAVRDMVMDDPALAQEVKDAREKLVKVAEPVALLHEEFVASKLIRATESNRQLQEVLVDFWNNHFNIDIRKAPCGVLKVIDDRDVIRPHVWGKFRDLLEASAKSPAMLVYLDNFQSISDNIANQPLRRRGVGPFGRNRFGNQALLGQQPGAGLNSPNPMTAQIPPAKPKPKRKTLGLNENYGREIMELHTLGVGGGYTQQDVRDVARCFTGWSIVSPDGLRPRINRYDEAGEFRFFPRLHDDGEKVVLGHHIPAGGGMRDGEIVLDLLANDPSTRKHISYELCQRLVCDDPPYSLVAKCVETWQKTDGDLREIVRTIVTSPEFFSVAAVKNKIKSPFEYAISSVRAMNGTLDPGEMINRLQLPREANSLVRPPQGGGFLDVNTTTLLGQITTMGEPLFQYQAPTGFPEDSRKWVSSGALISRLNFSLALTGGKIRDIKLDNMSEDAGPKNDPNSMIDLVSTRILHGGVSPATRSTLMNEAKVANNGSMGASLTPNKVAALLLGSPEFQRR